MSINPRAIPAFADVRRVHVVAVCGTGMSAFARILLDAGKEVCGSDLRADPPTGPALRDWGVDLRLGYAPEHLAGDTDLVVVGNAVPAGNAIAAEAIRRGIPLTHMPAALDLLLGEARTRLVVAGTHGKSTTSTVAAWILRECGLDPGWLIGATPSFGPSGHWGTGPFVIEGDEYNAAYFDRRAKFFHYRPNLLAVTNVEFDHADLYPDLAAIRAAFAELVAAVPAGGLVALTPACAWLAEHVHGAEVYRLDEHGFRVRASGAAGVRFTLDDRELAFPLPGEHGAIDAALAYALAVRAGARLEPAAAALAAFPGLKLRQERLAEGETAVVRDFGHHPSEIRATLAGLKTVWPAREVWLAFEPRSYTSRTARFQKEYAAVLRAADRVYIAPVYRPEALREPPLDTAALAQTLGDRAFAAPTNHDLGERLLADLQAAAPRERLVVFFSNGTFDGVPERVAAAVRR